MPVWDKNVLNQLLLEAPSRDCEERLDKVVLLYNAIVKWYDEYLKTANAEEIIAQFDKLFPDSKLTTVKKVDLMLRSMGANE